ncbi:MAG: N-acetylmuramoyl-L-alanine amidase [Anaerolineae bacterium]|nr:N-acetylmuramoyl-L-alanine amidase [Anaerolineae bacterium]
MLNPIRWLTPILLLALALAFVGPAAADEPPAPRGRVFLDPGHGGPDPGAVFYGDGFTVREAEVNLGVALLTADRLRARGFEVFLSRETNDQAGGSEDANGDGRVTTRDGLQSVVDEANRSGADLFLSIHHNGSTNRAASGTEVYYCADRPFADASFGFGALVLNHLLAKLQAQGYTSYNRGVMDDSALYTRGAYRGHLFVLGPLRSPRPAVGPRTDAGPRPDAFPSARSAPKLRATEMPGVLSEALFVSNPTEAWLLSQPRIQAALADAFADAVDDYFTP